MSSLSKNQALRLICDIVDGEASEEEKIAFFEYIKHDSEVEKQFHSTLQIKRLLSEKLPKHPAPDHLKESVLKRLEKELEADQYQDRPARIEIADVQSARKEIWRPVFFSGLRYLAAAAVILSITLMLVELLDRTTGIRNTETLIVENLSAQHFMNADGTRMDPHFSTASTQEAEVHLKDHLGHDMTIPKIEGTVFAGIVIADFQNGIQTPMFEYVQDGFNENIYVFAFNLEDIQNIQYMKREENAAKSCSTDDDYFVNNVNGVHVVSWLWNNHWYVAVSNHEGHDLAALVEPFSTN